ncbi:hypothetical protein C6P44_004593 [Monosporozyma unispora]|nr:hypothetical protein C6P44_004593 [Kazachstania unispora]
MLKKLLPVSKKDDKGKDSSRIKNKHDIHKRSIPRTILDSHEIIDTTHFESVVIQPQPIIKLNYDSNTYVPFYYESLKDINISKQTTLQTQLPFGDGSNKVFGYENFGNTCYCNSILQCLYYNDIFRINILTYPLQKYPSNNTPNTNDNIHTATTNNNNNNTYVMENTYNNDNNSYNIIMKRHRKRAMNGTKKRFFTLESFQPIVKSSTIKDNSPEQNNNNTNSNTSNNNNRKSIVRNNIYDNTTEQNQRRSSSFTAFARHKRNKSLSPEMYYTNSSNGNNNTQNDSENIGVENKIEPHHTTVMAADFATEKLHDGCERIIVGRNVFISSTNHSRVASTSYSSSSIHSSRSQTPSPNSPLLNPSKSYLNLENSLGPAKSTSSLDILNSEKLDNNTLDQYTSEKRKKSALIDGPILNIDYMVNVTARQNIFNGLKDIFECITENDRLTGIVSPIQFMHILKKENILFNTSSQQDAHELLNFILNDVNDYLQTFNESSTTKYLPTGIRNSILDQFQGILTNGTRCLTCDTRTSNNEPFLDLPIEMPNEEDSINIQDFLNDYNQTEFLRGSNKFYCNQCSSLQEAERVVTITTLPPTLSLHLKRFKYSEELNTNVKLFNKIHYPLVLDVSSNVDIEHTVYKRYELASVVVHMGNSPQHGHYVSLCKSSLYGWLLFDDETVESVSENTVLKFIGDETDQSTAYVLFYKELVQNINEEDAKDLKEGTEANRLKSQDLVSVSDILPKCRSEYEERIDNLIKTDDHLKEVQEQQMQKSNQLNNLNGSQNSSFRKSNSYASERSINSLLRSKSGNTKGSDKKKKRRSRLMTFIMK